MTKLNLVLWVVGLTLQCVLLTALFRRDIVRRLPIFTILIAFYILRSIALYGFSMRLRGPSYALIFGGLALVDFVLQTAVAWELSSSNAESAILPLHAPGVTLEPARRPPLNASLLRRLAIFCVLMIAAAGFAVLLSAHIHANPRVPMDRGILFNSALYLLVFASSLVKKTPTPIRRMIEGFAVYGGVSILSQIGRTVAAAQRKASAYNRWSYAEAAAYLAVIFFWIIVLPKQIESIVDTPDALSSY